MKNNLILLVLALVVLGLVFLLQNRSRAKAQEDVFAFDSATVADAAAFRVVRDTDTVHVALDNRWVVLPDSFPADTGKVSKMLGRIFTLQSDEMISQNPERLKEFGMDSSEAKHVRVTDKRGEALAEVVIGKSSAADYSSTYWKYAGKPEVYRTPENFTWEIRYAADDWKDRELFSFENGDARSVEVTWTDTTGKTHAFKLEAENDSTWKMVQPEKDSVKKEDAEEMVRRFGDMNIDQFITDKDTNAARVDLGKPAINIKLALKDGKSFELKGSQSYDDYIYIRHPAFPRLVKVSDWRFKPFRKTPAMLLGKEKE